jgi:hypothetical protein
MPNPPATKSQITFLYYPQIEPAASFFERTLGFELVVDQGWARIYRTCANAFIGIVAGDKGFHQPQKTNAVLITLVVDHAADWYHYLQEQGVTTLTQLQQRDEIGIECFFFEDPGGYTFEVQQFLSPKISAAFG